MIKKVLVESDGFVSNIFHDDSWQELELQEGQSLEDREYEQYDGGWYPLGQKPLTEAEKLKLENAELKEQLVRVDTDLSLFMDFVLTGGM